MNWIKLLCIGWIIVSMSCSLSEQSKRSKGLPNIIILLADDLGYSDLGCYGGIAKTPNIDRLAKQGIRFSNFYAAAPNCSPSRAGLMTGRFPSKVGIYNYLPENHPMHLKGDKVTIAEIVKEQGYRTGHFGKWHLGCLPQNPSLNQPQPIDQGFDYSLGTANNAQPSHLNPVNFVRNGVKVGEMKGYSCDIITKEAINWLDGINANATPFLLFMAFHEPHKKVASPPTLVANYSDHPKPDAEYLANVENMDQAVGRLLSALDSMHLDENTMIFFASDNGSYRNGSNAPLLGGKSFVYEGGIRVPGILTWKGKIQADSIVHEPVSLIDILPTICDVTGSEHPKEQVLDGTSLLPIIQNQPFQRAKNLSWFFYRTTPEIAMRIGDYVILGSNADSSLHTHPMTEPDMKHINNLTLKNFEIYDLKQDISQSNPIDPTTLSQGVAYQEQLLNRLKEIQSEGPNWADLPAANGVKKLKSQWRKLRPTGFSN